MLRSVTRGLVERAFGGRWARRRIAGYHCGVLVLALHNVVPDGAAGEGDPSLHLPLSRFLAIVDWLLTVARPVALDQALGEPVLDGPCFAVTFDDAYRGALVLALPELARRGLPATVFVATAMIGGQDFWWDALAEPGRGLSAGVREHVLETLDGDDGAARAWAEKEGRPVRRMPSLWRSAGLDELREAAAGGLVSFAPHTAHHLALDRLDTARCEREVRESLEWLDRSALPWLPVLAYPYGRFSGAAVAGAAAAGCCAALRVDGGWIEPGMDVMSLPRLNVPAGMSVRGLALRAAGLWRR